MKNGLAVIADEIDFAWSDAEFFAGGEGGVSVDVAETEMELAEFAGGDRILFGDTENFFADGGGEGDARVIEEFDLQIGRRAGDTDERNVNAVNRGAGHHAEDEHGFCGHEQVMRIFNTEDTGEHREEAVRFGERGNETPIARISIYCDL